MRKAVDKLALETSDGTALTYAALLERSARAANALAAQGVKPGDRVAVQVDKSTDMIALECLGSGGMCSVVSTAYGRSVGRFDAN